MTNISAGRMLEEILEVSDAICSEWEIDFLESIGARAKYGGELSVKQHEILDRIYRRACASPY